MPTYTNPEPSVIGQVADMLERYHGELHSAEVRVRVLMARGKRDKNGDLIGDAIRVRGCRAAGSIKITSEKDRAAGLADAVLLLDGDRWDEWSAEQQAALIDHELTHLDLCTDGEGVVKRDDQGRPKLRTRPHDREFGWFDLVARRHGEHSFERSQFDEFRDGAYKQLWLNFATTDEQSEQGEQAALNLEVKQAFNAAGLLLQRNVVISRGRGVTKVRRRKQVAGA